MRQSVVGLMVPGYDTEASRIVYRGFDVWRAISGTVAKRGLAIDAGAHVGYWVRLLAQEFEKVIAFEPEPDNFACLKENIRGMNGDIVAHNVALGSVETEMCLRNHGHPGNSGTWHLEPGEGTRVIPLDDIDWHQPVDFIKIDVEGYEAPLLRGAKRTIEQHKPAILIELNTNPSENYQWDDNEARLILDIWGYMQHFRLYDDCLFLPQDF